MSTSKEFVLYSYFRSSASYRVRIALEIKSIDYEYRTIHLLNNGGEQHGADYTKLNPSREVPTLIHNAAASSSPIVLGQSVAIIDYLDRAVPTPRLFPENAHHRALVLQACEIINSGSQPLHNLRVLKKLVDDFKISEDQKTEWTRHWIRYGFEAFEAAVKAHSGKFSFGDSVTAADCFLIPQLANADRFQISTAPYPILEKIRANCEKIPAFVKASPAQQMDFPKT